MRSVLSTALAGCLSMTLTGVANAADCRTDLTKADGVKELSATLKCLEDRIRALESGGGGGGGGATGPVRFDFAEGEAVQEADRVRWQLQG